MSSVYLLVPCGSTSCIGVISHSFRLRGAAAAAKYCLSAGGLAKIPAANWALSFSARRIRNTQKVMAVFCNILTIAHPKLGGHPVIIAAAAQTIGPHIMQPLANFASCHVITPVNTSRSLCTCKPCGCFCLFCPNAPLRRRRDRGSKLPPFPPPGPGRSAAAKDFC